MTESGRVRVRQRAALRNSNLRGDVNPWPGDTDDVQRAADGAWRERVSNSAGSLTVMVFRLRYQARDKFALA